MRIHFKKVLLVIVFISIAPAFAGSYDDFFRAVKQDNDKAVAALLSRGFDPNTVDQQNVPGLHLALSESALKVAAVLIESRQIKLEQRNPAGETPLMLAALRGHRALVARLIARRVEINQTGWTALHYAAAGGHADIVQTLLDRYAYIDAESPNRTTPLMMAAGYGSPQAVAVLLKGGADASLRNEQGLTALDFARNANSPDALAMLRAPAPAGAATAAAAPVINRSAPAPVTSPTVVPAAASAPRTTSASAAVRAPAAPSVATPNTASATPRGGGWGVAAPIPLPNRAAP